MEYKFPKKEIKYKIYANNIIIQNKDIISRNFIRYFIRYLRNLKINKFIVKLII